MSVINCLPRNDAAISRDRYERPSQPSLFLFFSCDSFFFFPCVSRPSTESPLPISPPSRPLAVLVLLCSPLSRGRPVPPFHLLRFFLSIGPELVMHLNNLFISDSTLWATRPLVIMRGKHSRRRENVSGGFLSRASAFRPVHLRSIVSPDRTRSQGSAS